jgi:8-oxo-dGTP diphosphatase
MNDLTLRLAAYAVCVRGDEILLARWVSRNRSQRHWTLPGGKVEHGEDPYDAVVREVEEETGYDVEVEALLGVDSRRPRPEHHNVGVFYLVRIVGGDLRHETDGSTDLAEWVVWDAVDRRERSSLVDVGRTLFRSRTKTGHVDPIPVGGLIRD